MSHVDRLTEWLVRIEIPVVWLLIVIVILGVWLARRGIPWRA